MTKITINFDENGYGSTAAISTGDFSINTRQPYFFNCGAGNPVLLEKATGRKFVAYQIVDQFCSAGPVAVEGQDTVKYGRRQYFEITEALINEMEIYAGHKNEETAEIKEAFILTLIEAL